MKVKPFLRWAGGKQKSVDYLLKEAPDHSLYDRYFEPFLGAGSLFFANGFDNAVISDVNAQLINAYSHVKSDYLSLFELLEKHKDSFSKNTDFYYSIREDYNLNKESYDLYQASRFILLIHTNYNGMYRINKNGNYNVPLGKITPNLPDLENLKNASQKLKNVEIINTNYAGIIDSVKQNDFIYFDPPYPPLEWEKHENQYTANRFNKEDHENLAKYANFLSEKGCFVMISYPDIDFIQNLYQGWNIKKLDVFRSISCKKHRKVVSELIIKNF